MTDTTDVVQRARQNLEERTVEPTWYELLQGQRDQIARALPISGSPERKQQAADRMARSALTLMRQTPAIRECTRDSVLGGLLTIAELGLEVGPLGQAYLVPFNRKTDQGWVKEAQFIAGYKGLQDLARRSGEIDDIAARVVYEHDFFDWSYGSEEHVTHRFDLAQERGKPIGAYCVAVLRNGRSHVHVMQPHDIEKRMRMSKGHDKASSPWVQWPAEMWAKTAMRGAASFLPLSVEAQTMLAHDENIRNWSPTAGEGREFVPTPPQDAVTASPELQEVNGEPEPQEAPQDAVSVPDSLPEVVEAWKANRRQYYEAKTMDEPGGIRDLIEPEIGPTEARKISKAKAIDILVELDWQDEGE